MPAGLPLTQCPPDRRWLMPAGRRSRGKLIHHALSITPPSAAHRPRRSWGITPPSVGKANPPSAAPSSSRGRPTRRPWSSSPPAPAVEWSSQPVMVLPAGRGRIWPDCDQGLFKSLFSSVFRPGGLRIPLSCPMDFFWGGTKVPAVEAGTRPRPRGTTCLGLLSSLVLLGLRLSVPLWRPRLVYVSVSVLWGLQSAHPPSLVVLLQHGTHLPGGGSYVRPLSCVSCVPASLFPYMVCFLSSFHVIIS